MVEIWTDGERIGTFKQSGVVRVGDVVEVDREGEIEPYEVTKVYRFFDVDGLVTERMNVTYCGPARLGAFVV